MIPTMLIIFSPETYYLNFSRTGIIFQISFYQLQVANTALDTQWVFGQLSMTFWDVAKKKAGEEEREKENPSYLFMTGACFIPKSVAKNENS